MLTERQFIAIPLNWWMVEVEAEAGYTFWVPGSKEAKMAYFVIYKLA